MTKGRPLQRILHLELTFTQAPEQQKGFRVFYGEIPRLRERLGFCNRPPGLVCFFRRGGGVVREKVHESCECYGWTGCSSIIEFNP